MFWDIVIAVFAALMQGTAAFLGWYVTINPLIPGDPKYGRKKRIYTRLFVFVGLVGVFLVGFAAYRAPRERAHFAILPAPAYEQQGMLMPTWSNAAFLQVNMPLAFNVVYGNLGSGTATNTAGRGHSFIEANGSDTSEADVLAEFERMRTTEPSKGMAMLPKGMQQWITARGVTLSPEDKDNLISGRRVVYVVAEFLYADDSGKHTRHYCQYLQTPQAGGNLIWANCSHYNDEE